MGGTGMSVVFLVLWLVFRIHDFDLRLQAANILIEFALIVFACSCSYGGGKESQDEA